MPSGSPLKYKKNQSTSSSEESDMTYRPIGIRVEILNWTKSVVFPWKPQKIRFYQIYSNLVIIEK